MLVDPSNPAAGSAVTGAIRQASQATGTSFNYLLATAQVESGLNPQAGASTSSARGLFQFIDQTWLATMKQSGPGLGYGRYADAITKTASGHYTVKDPALRSQILKLRNDPTANAVMAGAFTNANAAILTSKLGRPPSESELYIAHFLGAGGAAKLINLAASNPNAKASDYFANAAHANSSIFYDRSTGAARSLAQVRNVLSARYDVARSRPGAPAGPVEAESESPGGDAVASIRPVNPVNPVAPVNSAKPANSVAPVAAADPVPDTAGITNAYAAAAAPPPPAVHDKQIFHGLFQDPDRAAPVAAVVSELWGVPSPVPSAKGASKAPPTPASIVDLFKDSGEKS
jgi:hypothetical protein